MVYAYPTQLSPTKGACGPTCSEKSLRKLETEDQIEYKTQSMKRYSLQSKMTWQTIRNNGTTLGQALRRVLALREGGLTRHWCLTAISFGRFVAALQKNGGWRGVVVYLKGCHVLLQQVVGGQKLDNPRRLGCAISRSRQGLPRIIPNYHRKMILSGDIWAVRIWASFFWLYRVIDIPGKIKLQSILRPFEVPWWFLVEWMHWLVAFLPVFLTLVGKTKAAKEVSTKGRSLWTGYFLSSSAESLLRDKLAERTALAIEYLGALLLPKEETMYLYGRLPRKERKTTLMTSILTDLNPEPKLLLTSGPNSAKSSDEAPGPGTRTSIGSILTDVLIWREKFPQLLAELNQLWPQAMMFVMTIITQVDRVCDSIESLKTNPDVNPVWGSREQCGYWEDDGGAYNKPLMGFSTPRGLGKLGFLPEPAGKIRVFAMVDSLTQMLLAPLHEAIFEMLKRIPQDGTFDQLAPAKLLASRGLKDIFSYDLSAATDRFPVSLQQALLGFLLDPEVARHWRSVLTDRPYIVPRFISEKQRVPSSTPREVTYGAGQPMGAYTSWAVFALTHHLLVQYAAFQAGYGFRWFELYALLGDDVVIGCSKVAEKYLLLLQVIGVEVGLAKSLISHNGSFEFAKRTFRSTTDISGISLDEVGASITDPSVLEALLSHCNVRGLMQALRVTCRVLGYGFRTRSRLRSVLNTKTRLQGIAILLSRPSSVWGLTFSEWIRQVSPDFAPPISNEGLEVLKDAIRQKLVSTAERLADVRLRFLVENRNPIEGDLETQAVLPNVLERISGPQGLAIRLDEPTALAEFLRVPVRFLRGVSTPELAEFLTNWVLRPYLEIVKSEMTELLVNLDMWRNETGEGNFDLDEIYKSIEELIAILSRVDVSLNILLRVSSKDDSRVRVRSRAVRLWRNYRPMVRGFRD